MCFVWLRVVIWKRREPHGAEGDHKNSQKLGGDIVRWRKFAWSAFHIWKYRIKAWPGQVLHEITLGFMCSGQTCDIRFWSFAVKNRDHKNYTGQRSWRTHKPREALQRIQWCLWPCWMNYQKPWGSLKWVQYPAGFPWEQTSAMQIPCPSPAAWLPDPSIRVMNKSPFHSLYK